MSRFTLFLIHNVLKIRFSEKVNKTLKKYYKCFNVIEWKQKEYVFQILWGSHNALHYLKWKGQTFFMTTNLRLLQFLTSLILLTPQDLYYRARPLLQHSSYVLLIKEIEIIHRLFLDIAMYCQASSNWVNKSLNLPHH